MGSAVEVYDFGRPATLAREHSRVLELAFETFARQWATQWTAKIRVRSHVSIEQLTMETYDEYAASLPATTAMVICALPQSDAKSIVQFPLSAALSWIIHMVGGRSDEFTEDRAFTPIEQALIRNLMVDTLDNLNYSLGDLLPAGLSVAGIQYNSQFAQVAASTELVIVARFSIKIGDYAVPASVMLPSALVLAQLTTVNPTVAVEDAREFMRRQVVETPVELALRLKPVAIKPRDVLRLSVGDVIPLAHAHDRPLDLVTGDQLVATAAVGSSGARLACVVTGPTPSEESA